MHDGKTRKIVRKDPPPDRSEFFASHRVVLVVLSGASAGEEHLLDDRHLTLGRGAHVDLRFDDDAMSQEHAAFELVDSCFRVRDLASTNGIRLNGHPTLAAELKPGDKLEIGSHTFRYVQEVQSQ